MKWRLRKHQTQHESTNTRFCHYFNNGGFCPYDEHGCMFKHEHAPNCLKKGVCRAKICQFKHQNESEIVDNEEAASDLDDDLETEYDDELEMNEDTINPTSVRCNYGLCDFRTILFASKIDFHAHLRSDHGFDDSDF